MVETEAKTKRCPMMGGAYCLAAECIAWRWAGAADADGIVRRNGHPEQQGWCEMVGGDPSIAMAIDDLSISFAAGFTLTKAWLS